MTVTVFPCGPDKFKIYIEDEYLMTVAAQTWYSLGYGNIEDLTQEEIDNFQFVIDGRKAYDSAIRMLTLRAHSEFELRQKLERKGHLPDMIDYAVEKCKELGFVNDLEFGIRYGTELVQKKRYGPIRLRNALMSKGLSRDDIIDSMCAIDYDSNACIIEIIQRKYTNCFDTEKNKRKVVRGIMNLGYSYSDIKRALEEYNSTTDGEKYEL